MLLQPDQTRKIMTVGIILRPCIGFTMDGIVIRSPFKALDAVPVETMRR
jgi:hypothetical protein